MAFMYCCQTCWNSTHMLSNSQTCWNGLHLMLLSNNQTCWNDLHELLSNTMERISCGIIKQSFMFKWFSCIVSKHASLEYVWGRSVVCMSQTNQQQDSLDMVFFKVVFFCACVCMCTRMRGCVFCCCCCSYYAGKKKGCGRVGAFPLFLFVFFLSFFCGEGGGGEGGDFCALFCFVFDPYE